MKTKAKPMQALSTAKPYLPKRNAPGSPLALVTERIQARALNVTPTQLTILRFVDAYRREHFVAPTIDEIAAHIERCKSNTARHVHLMLDAGLLRASYVTAPTAFPEPYANRVRAGSLHVPADILERLRLSQE